MRRSLFALLAVVAVLTVPSSALAARVLVLGHGGRVEHRDDRYLTGPSVTPAPATAGPARPPLAGSAPLARAATSGGGGIGGTSGSSGSGGSGGSGGAKKKQPGKKHKPVVTVQRTLATLRDHHAIDPRQYGATLGAFNAALAAEKRLSGTRRAELTHVTTSVHTLAVTHQLTASRLPAVTATLTANRRWWTTGSLLGSGARVEFAGSQLVWEYYPGQGIQLQVLGSFGKADGLYTAGQSQYQAMTDLLSELIPLASQRGGGLTWEYYFSFDGGAPPWTSAMSQATGLEALSRAYQATGNQYYLQVAAKAMPVFSRRPPQGVALPTARGTRFVQYTFAPSLSIINAFLQTLIGLYDYAQVSHDATAARLFARGNAEAMSEVPRFDTGAWSYYTPGQEDTLDYHELVTGFLSELCQRTNASVYCRTAQHFSADLKTPPTLADLTPSVKRNHPFDLRFRLSKISRVGVTIARGSHTVLSTSATFGHGTDRVAVAKLGPGSYSVTLTATDLAGNFTRTPATLTVR